MLGGRGAVRTGMMFDAFGEGIVIPPIALSAGIRGGGGPLFPFTPRV
jgi:hypothetical protein